MLSFMEHPKTKWMISGYPHDFGNLQPLGTTSSGSVASAAAWRGWPQTRPSVSWRNWSESLGGFARKMSFLWFWQTQDLAIFLEVGIMIFTMQTTMLFFLMILGYFA